MPALTINGLLAACLVVWWAVGVALLTIDGPFTLACNAYFALWIGFGCSLRSMGFAFTPPGTAATTNDDDDASISPPALAPPPSVATGLVICSIVVICTASADINAEITTRRDHHARPQLVYILVVACLSIIATPVVICSRRRGKPPHAATLARCPVPCTLYHVPCTLYPVPCTLGLYLTQTLTLIDRR